VRSTLGKFPGVEIQNLSAGQRDFDVKFDPAKVKLDDMLAALKAAGEGVKRKS
jgi:hypothetical protein